MSQDSKNKPREIKVDKKVRLSREFLVNRGSCCGCGCAACPYYPRHTAGTRSKY